MNRLIIFVIGVLMFSNIVFSSPTLFAALPQCVDSGGTCVIGGTACCVATESCSGTFPNTTCQ